MNKTTYGRFFNLVGLFIFIIQLFFFSGAYSGWCDCFRRNDNQDQVLQTVEIEPGDLDKIMNQLNTHGCLFQRQNDSTNLVDVGKYLRDLIEHDDGLLLVISKIMNGKIKPITENREDSRTRINRMAGLIKKLTGKLEAFLQLVSADKLDELYSLPSGERMAWLRVAFRDFRKIKLEIARIIHIDRDEEDDTSQNLVGLFNECEPSDDDASMEMRLQCEDLHGILEYLHDVMKDIFCFTREVLLLCIKKERDFGCFDKTVLCGKSVFCCCYSAERALMCRDNTALFKFTSYILKMVASGCLLTSLYYDSNSFENDSLNKSSKAVALASVSYDLCYECGRRSNCCLSQDSSRYEIMLNTLKEWSDGYNIDEEAAFRLVGGINL